MFDVQFAVKTMKLIITQGIPVSFYILFFTLLISLPLGFLVGPGPASSGCRCSARFSAYWCPSSGALP